MTRECDKWSGAPYFEVCVGAMSSWRELATEEAENVGSTLQIVGPWGTPAEINDHNCALVDWRQADPVFGVWHLNADKKCGVSMNLLPSNPAVLWIGITPYFMSAFGTFPWNLHSNWVSKQVIELHSLIIRYIRRLNKITPLTQCWLQEEGWTFQPHGQLQGIFVHQDVAHQAGFEGIPFNGFVCLPFSEA